MSDLTNCPRCGATHPAAISGGLCPHCLLAGLLNADHEPRLGEQAGDAVGPYELIEVLGEGGMGSVWRARQLHPVEREVALKIIRLGMNTRELVSRFNSERQSLAMMDHPGIARVYEAGATSEGRPYFAMELVEGEPVTDYCASHGLKLEERLRLFMEICAAVAHAHRKGVIHRDLKPSNVMVVERARGPQVKVIDFGIAKLLETKNDGRTFATKAGHAVGTPGYMSPEQAGAEPDIDTRSDVYSLGALLYEILTGSPPLGKETFREVAYAEVMRLIRETDPPRPSTRLGPATAVGTAPPLHIARDLDRIVMKALSRERERRYGGAASLGDDVQRFLNHEPVTATDPTPAYRAAKFVRKHRLPVAFSVLLILSLVASLVFISQEARRANDSTRRERSARLAALSALADSYRNAGLAAAGMHEDALAALWFMEAAEVAPHDPGRARANRLRAALHVARAPLMVRMIPCNKINYARLQFDPASDFLHMGTSGHRHVLLDVERGLPVDFGRTLDAACLCGPAQAAISRPGGFEIRDLRSNGILQSVAVAEPVRDLWASADGTLFFVSSNPCRIWNRDRQDWQTGPVDQPVRPRFASFSPDGKWLLTVDDRAKLRVFPTRGESPGSNFEAMQVHEGMGFYEWLLPSFSADSSRVRTKLTDALVKLDVRTGEIVERDKPGEFATDILESENLMTVRFTQAGPDTRVARATRHLPFGLFTVDGAGAFTSGGGEFIDLEGRRQSVVPLRGGGAIALSPDGSLVAFGQLDSVSVHRIIREEPYIDIAGPAGGRVALSDDESVFASAGMARLQSGESSTRGYRVEDGLPVGPVTELGHQQLCATFLADGRFLAGCRLEAASGRGDPEAVGGPGQLQAWDLATGLPNGPPLRLPSEPWALRRAPDDRWIAVLTRDGRLWRVDPQLDSAAEILRLPVESRSSISYFHQGNLAFSEDGSRLFANGFGSKTWAIDPGSGKVLFDTGPRPGDALGLEVAHGLLLAPFTWASPDQLFSATDGSLIPLPAAECSFFPLGSKLSPDGRKVLLAGRRRISVVDWKSGQRVGNPYFPERVLLPFSDFVADTPWMLTAASTENERSSLALWDSRTGHRLNPDWPFPDKLITDLVTTRDSRRTILCLAGFGHRIVLWDEILKHEEWHDGLDPANRRFLAEIQAGRLLVEGSTVQTENNTDWLERWTAFDRRHPNHFTVDPPRSERIRWHRNRAARYSETHPAAAEWHLQRLRELGADGP